MINTEVKTPTIFKAFFNGINSSSSLKSYKITLTVDETQKDELLQMAFKYNIGAPILILAYDGGDDSLTAFKEETQDQTKRRFQKQMFVKIDELANKRKVNKEIIKKEVKQYLVNNDYLKNIESTTKDLDIKALSFTINYLNTKISQN
jgi:hypothetical protein